jgi:Uma2 family endonuclease
VTTTDASRAQAAQRHRFSLAEYARMTAAGLFAGRRVELLDGDVIDVPPMNAPHWTALYRLQRAFERALEPGRLLVQMPVQVPDDGEPEPDLAVLRAGWQAQGEKPTASDLVLAIEVSDTTLDLDRRVKAPLYARAGVPELWIVDLPHRLVWVHTDPRPAGYGREEALRPGDHLRPTRLPELDVPVSALFETSSA